MNHVLTDISPHQPPRDEEIRARLEQRLGHLHARQRLGIEHDHESAFRHGTKFFHLENAGPARILLRAALKLTGLYWRGNRNTERIEVRHNHLAFRNLHVDMNPGAMQRLAEILPALDYDLCVLTGDYRGETYGPFDQALEGVAQLRPLLRGAVYGVLGNHDSIRMVPVFEDMGIRMLLNESVPLHRASDRIHLAGIDDAHYYRVENFERAAGDIPHQEFSILLSHTPEVYRQAAHAGFDLMLAGHTHGGQICLPGAHAIMLDSKLPRRLGAGAWTYNHMAGYTSVGVGSCIVAVRLNCPPEITLHHLSRARNS
jgi:uncharacterized protein